VRVRAGVDFESARSKTPRGPHDPIECGEGKKEADGSDNERNYGD